MFLGEKEISGVYLGDKEMSGIYIGDKENWTNFTPFYVIENGLLVDGNYSSASRIGESVHTTTNSDYGLFGHTSSGGTPKVGATVKFKTNGAKTLSICAKENEGAGANPYVPILKVVADGTEILNVANSNYSDTIDVKGYSEIAIEYSLTTPSSANAWIGAYITEIYCGK